jgi:adenylate cyclase
MLGVFRDLRDLVVEFRRPGETELSGRAMARYGGVALAAAIIVTNIIGTAAVVVIAVFVVPFPSVAHQGHVRLVNAVAAVIYAGVAVPVGAFLGVRRMLPMLRWMREESPAGPREQRIVLRAPARLSLMQVSLWLVAAVLFGVLNARYSGTLGVRAGIVVVLTGLVVAAMSYLVTERILRPVAARALAEATPQRLAVPGVATRSVLAWALGTGVPVLGMIAIGILALAEQVTKSQLAVTMISLGGVAIVVGLLAVVIAARLTADPIDAVRRALAKVEHGELDTQVPVYDGTQIGQLQLGFNRMVTGLAERERIREAFGVYVDPAVAEHILEEGTSLEGEEVEVTVMFIDIRNFTGFAERTDAGEVVSTINRLFERIVPIIHEHGGRVDKFIGDGPRHADEALAAALKIDRAVREADDIELEIGIGLNSGVVVAGNVGGAGRLEFSVIGDAVNVAARVESTTRQTGDRILIAERTRELLREPPVELIERDGLPLKGKSEPVKLYAPA